ncbi:MAG TPA: hypothetical protein VL443_29735 [Cyclobacteriaceae bacterium]|nr:hypothetical protein [Cyclobacteriaceae bacterium]
MTIENQISLQEFEAWLYTQAELAEKMSDDLILEVFAFNYNQSGAVYAFKQIFLPYFDEEEFMLWKIKANLQDLIDGKNDRLRILNDFYWLGYNRFLFLISIGFYLHDLEEPEYSRFRPAELTQNLKADAQKLLLEIELQEKDDVIFKISEFKETKEESL